jgi:hypothetical protein
MASMSSCHPRQLPDLVVLLSLGHGNKNVRLCRRWEHRCASRRMRRGVWNRSRAAWWRARCILSVRVRESSSLFFSSCVVERCSLAAHQPLLWLGCASCFSASSRDAGAWHVQQLARVLRQPAALQRLRQPAAPSSIFFSRECIVARTRAAAVRTAAWRRFCLSPPHVCVRAAAWRRLGMAIQQAEGTFSSPSAWRYWPVYIGSAISWETHTEASSVCYDRNAAMQNPFLSLHESLLFQSRTTPYLQTTMAGLIFFFACVYMSWRSGVC